MEVPGDLQCTVASLSLCPGGMVAARGAVRASDTCRRLCAQQVKGRGVLDCVEQDWEAGEARVTRDDDSHVDEFSMVIELQCMQTLSCRSNVTHLFF